MKVEHAVWGTAIPLSDFAMSINGRRITSDDTELATNPATEEPIASFPLASRKQLDLAVEAAKVAFTSWRETDIATRRKALEGLADQIEKNYEAFLTLLTTEQGKPRAGAEWEIGGSIYWLREIAKQSLPEEVVRDDGENRVVTRYTPIGVIGGITPWNFPLLLAVWKIAPALMAGNTMVLKPSPFTPLCTLWFGELAQEVLPPVC